MAEPVNDQELEILLELLDEQPVAAVPTAHEKRSASVGVLETLLAEEFALRKGQEAADSERFAVYLEDLRSVLRLSGGAGLRVLRRWLEGACAFSRISRPEPEIWAAAALADYARERMAEIAAADPAGHLKIQLSGAKQWAEREYP